MYRPASRGTITPLAASLTMVSMLLTLGFLRYSVSAVMTQERYFASEKALLMAESGVNEIALPRLPYVTQDTLLVAEPLSKGKMGLYDSVACFIYTDDNDQTIYAARATGIARIRNPYGPPKEVRRRVTALLRGGAFSDYMYFTESEEPGGGPYTDGYVTFGASDTLEGKVHTNGTLQMSSYGCPRFVGEYSSVEAHDGIQLGMCSDNIFEGTYDDSADYIVYPPKFSVDMIKNTADYTFTADDLLGRISRKDTLIMTQLEFLNNGFKISQWPYQIPPIAAVGPQPLDFTWDTDTTAAGINNESIGVDAGFSSIWGYALADSVFFHSDSSGTSAAFDEYDIGDTIIIASTSPDSNKYWEGVILEKGTLAGRYLFRVSFSSQSFPGGSTGFAAGEPVRLSYKAPLDPTKRFNNFYAYHNHPDDGQSQCPPDGFHHFDFPPPVNPDDFFYPPTTFTVSRPTVIYIKEGQVRVKGIVDGRYTIITDEKTYYRRSDTNQWDVVYDNIWLIDDVVYEDSHPVSGAVVEGSPNRLGLISGANVIIANTAANGAARQLAGGGDIRINAAIMALNESFVVHYWQNTLTNFYQPNQANPSASLADGRGPYRNPDAFVPHTTGDNDMRGRIYLWGSIVQKKRGYVRRNMPGPYNASPGIGYFKNYNFDYNFWVSPPPKFPNTTNSDGGVKLVLKAYGETVR